MFVFILRYVIIAVVVFVVLYVLFRLLLPNHNPNACPRCDGKGYWIGVRERERCDRCKGTGLL